MSKICANTKFHKYPVVIDNNFTNIIKYINFVDNNSKIVIITDDCVKKLYLEEFNSAIFGYFNPNNVYVYEIKNGESSKNLDTVKSIYDFLINAHIERTDVIIALGGGVVGDISGYVAATFLRGIPLIQVPTTLLSQVDSSIGGKVGVNFCGIKNVIGAFYQPHIIYTNVQVLKTLPIFQIKCGIAEIIVHAIISNPSILNYIIENYEKIYNDRDSEVLEQIVYDNVCVKLLVVDKDEKESGLRRILNFGHTFGHAIEAYFSYKYSHGECISIGIVIAYKIAAANLLIKEEDVIQIINILELFGLPTFIKDINWDSVLEIMTHDKKMENGKLIFILPKKIGEVVQSTVEIDDKLRTILLDTSYEEYLSRNVLKTYIYYLNLVRKESTYNTTNSQLINQTLRMLIYAINICKLLHKSDIDCEIVCMVIIYNNSLYKKRYIDNYTDQDEKIYIEKLQEEALNVLQLITENNYYPKILGFENFDQIKVVEKDRYFELIDIIKDSITLDSMIDIYNETKMKLEVTKKLFNLVKKLHSLGNSIQILDLYILNKVN